VLPSAAVPLTLFVLLTLRSDAKLIVLLSDGEVTLLAVAVAVFVTNFAVTSAA